MSLASGTKLGPYEIVSPLGAGGMGEVYRAKDTRLGRDVAVKILAKEMSADTSFGRIFTATSRPSLVSFARYTSPIPPAPSGDTIS